LSVSTFSTGTLAIGRSPDDSAADCAACASTQNSVGTDEQWEYRG
jgi:hypothetical protein